MAGGYAAEGIPGDIELDGVTFPAAEAQVDFIRPGDAFEAMFPTGKLVDELDMPGVDVFKVTMINAGIPTILLNAEDIGYNGSELPEAINGDPAALACFETIRAHDALRMGLIKDIAEAAGRQHSPKVAFVAKPTDYPASSGKSISASTIDLNVRALSMGKLHHAMMGAAAVANGGGERASVTFGHPSGTLKVGAQASENNGGWTVNTVAMNHKARIWMEGWVRIPGDAF